MNRFLALLAPTAAAAAVAAAITIPAGADPSAGNDNRNDDGAQLNSCLRSHGVDVPADARGFALKQWIGDHSGDDAVMRAMKACDVDPGAPQQLVACLRAQGLDVPTAIDQLKPWLGRHADEASTKQALEACHVAVAPRDDGAKMGPPPCGDDKPAAPGAKPETTPAPAPPPETLTTQS